MNSTQPFTLTHSTISDSYIKEFMSFYRTHFPAATVTPKMHMLEEHTIPFLRRWHIGLGFMGEQGAESIHNSINQLEKHYTNMPNRVKRLEVIVCQHHLAVCPPLVVKKPPPIKYKTSE